MTVPGSFARDTARHRALWREYVAHVNESRAEVVHLHDYRCIAFFFHLT